MRRRCSFFRTARRAPLAIGALVIGAFGVHASAQTPNEWRPIGPTFSTVLAFERDPQTPSTQLAGTYFGGLYRSTDFGFTWTHVPTDFSTRSVFTLAYDPRQAQIVYAGTFQAGLFKSTDGGTTWTAINTGLSDLDIQAVAVDPFNSAVVLAATSNGGIFRSTNAGAGWTRADAASPPLRGKVLTFDPTRSGVVYVGTIGQGVYRSTDAGVTFAPFNAGLSATSSIFSLRFSPSADRTLYAGTDNGAFTQVDAEAAAGGWTNITHDLPSALVSDLLPHPTIPHLSIAATQLGVYVMQSDRVPNPHWVNWHPQATRTLTADPTGTVYHAASLHGGLITTSNFGVTWLPANTGIQNLFAGALALTNTGGERRLFVGSDFAIHRSVNGEFDVMTELRQAVFDLQVDPSNPQTIYAGTERGGVFKSIDGGASWASASENIVPAQILDVTQASDGGRLFAATTSGLYSSDDNGAQWTLSNTGDLSFILSMVADPTRAPIVYVGGPEGQVYRSGDGGLSWIRAANGLPRESIIRLAIAPWEKTYAITASGALYASSDDGRNWFSTSTGVSHPAVALATDPVRAWVLYLATSGGGVYKSESSGLQWTPRNQGLGSSFVFSVAVDPSNPARLFAGTDHGLYRSTDEADHWTAAGAGLPAGAVTQIAIDPSNGQHLWASIERAGIFRSQDGGATWTSANGSPANGLPTAGVVPVVLERDTSATLFAGTPVNGIYRSDDGGTSWRRSSTGLTLFVRGLVIVPTEQTIYAGSLGAGVFKSNDGAATWSSAGLSDRNIFKLALERHGAGAIYAATSQGVSRSLPEGGDWVNLGQKAAFVYAMTVDPRNRLRVFIGSTAGKVYRSNDAAETWANVSTGLPPGTVLALAIDGTSGTLFASVEGHGVYLSTNDGERWSALPAGAFGTETVAALAVDQTGSVYAATLGAGVFAFRNGAWQLANSGLTSRHIAHIAVANDGVLYASTLDAGLFRSTDAGASWQWASNGLTTSRVSSVTPSPVDAAVLYAATPDGVFRSATRGTTWIAVHAGLQRIAVQHIAVDRFNPRILYAATNGRGVYRSWNEGATWDAFSTGLLNRDVRAVAQGFTAGTIYAATLGGGVSRTVSPTGPPWIDAAGPAAVPFWTGGTTPHLVDPFALAIAVDPSIANVVYAATAGQGVMKSTNGGVDWTAANNGLEGLFLLSIAVDPQHPGTVYAGSSSHGVFYSTNGGGAWKPLNAGLFNHTVTALAIDPTDSTRIFAGTEGGGVFANQVALAPTTCTYGVSAGTIAAGSGSETATVAVSTQPGCVWRVDSGAEWITVDGPAQRAGSGSATLAIALNTSGDARSGVSGVAGTPVVISQEGQTRLFRLTVTKTGSGAGLVSSDWTGISCGEDCQQLFTDSLPVALTATAAQGSRFVRWEGDAECTDAAVVMTQDLSCAARFDATGDFDGDGLPDLWEAQFGLDPASPAGDDGADGDPDQDGRSNTQELSSGTHPRGLVRRYFAAGTTSTTARTEVTLFNPDPVTARVLVRLRRADGTEGTAYESLAPLTRRTLDTRTVTGFAAAEFSIIVESDAFLAVTRTIRLDAPFSSLADLGARAPSDTWYLGPATIGDDFQVRYVLFNPGPSASIVDLTMLPQPTGTPIQHQVTLPAGGRTSIDVGTLDASLSQTDVAAVVKASTPIVVESQEWLGERSVSSGVAAPESRFLSYLGELRTGPTFDTTISLFNPTAQAGEAVVTYVGEHGEFVQRTHSVGPFRGVSVPVRDEDASLADAASAAFIASPNTPMVVGRTTRWPGGQPSDWYEAHGATGTPAPLLRWAVARGTVGGADHSQSDLVVTNVTTSPTQVRVTLVFGDGTTHTKTFDVAPVRRRTIAIGADFPQAASGPFSVMVESVPFDGNRARPIMVELSTYDSPDGRPWTAGSSVPGEPIPPEEQ